MRLALLAALLAAVAVFPARAAERGPRTVICESEDGGSYACRIGYYYRVELVRQIGEGRCIKSRTWWLRENRIVVTNGCRGEFEVFRWGSRTRG